MYELYHLTVGSKRQVLEITEAWAAIWWELVHAHHKWAKEGSSKTRRQSKTLEINKT